MEFGGGEGRKRRARVVENACRRGFRVEEHFEDRGWGGCLLNWVVVDGGGGGDGGIVVARRVLVREAIRVARALSCSSFSVCVSAQRHAAPWMWILGRVSLGLKTWRHSVVRSRLGRAWVWGVHDISRGSSGVFQDTKLGESSCKFQYWCLTVRVAT